MPSIFAWTMIRRKQGLHHCLSSRNALSKNLRIDAHNLCPFNRTPRDAFMRPQHVLSGIALLSLGCRPETIVWAVWAGIVHAFYRMAGTWPWPHVRIECGKILPAIAYRNASGAIFMIAGTAWIIAALAHAFPYRVFASRFTHTVRGHVRNVLLSSFVLQTSARLRNAMEQVVSWDILYNATRTLTGPKCAAFIAPSIVQDDQSAKGYSRQVLCLPMTGSRLVVHDAFSLVEAECQALGWSHSAGVFLL